jgi:hypothetical protein
VIYLVSVFTNRTPTSSPDDEIQQSTALRWLAEFLTFAYEVMIPFTPRLVPAILPNLAHHVSMIQSAAIRTNKLLLGVIQKLAISTRIFTDENRSHGQIIPKQGAQVTNSHNFYNKFTTVDPQLTDIKGWFGS